MAAEGRPRRGREAPLTPSTVEAATPVEFEMSEYANPKLGEVYAAFARARS